MITYLVGALLTFVLCKICRGKTYNQNSDQWVTFGLTVLSWVGFIFVMAVAIYSIFKKDE